jgi:formate/nitrite transporter FocA (FNT family)
MADEVKQQEQVEQRTSPSGKIVYGAIHKEGDDELKRSTSALAWSGLAAGLSMGFSVLAEAMLQTAIPEASWRPLVVSFGYSVGFLIVVLGRQQLFTENTLTVILPLLQRRDGKTFRNVARLWTTVFLANEAGAFLFALVMAKSAAIDDGVRETMVRVAEASMAGTAATILLRGVFAGWLIAMMVWLLPFAESARVWVIVIITYVVGLAGFAHIIVGSTEAIFLMFGGYMSGVECVTHFMIPALVGNCIGGVALVAAINHAQVVAGNGGTDV